MKPRKRQRKKNRGEENPRLASFARLLLDKAARAEVDALLDLFWPAASGRKSLKELGW